MHRRIHRALGLLTSAVVLSTSLLTAESALAPAPASASYALPPTPAGLTAAIESPQPYIGQTTCDPTAKRGVIAFRELLLKTYADSRSLGIVRACGSGGQSEHKEGRAFDWAVSVNNAHQKGEADALLAWLLKTDQYGNPFAMARRLGIMYIIWNRHMWRAYDPGRGWAPYSGESAHTDHVHFSFGWNGAAKVTSYWDGTVAPTWFGPDAPPHITPVRRVSNIKVVRDDGSTTLQIGSTGQAVKVLQRELHLSPVDGSYGAETAAYVANFQVDQQLPVTQRFGPAEWKRLFPFPIAPFGAVDPAAFALGQVVLRGWTIDADTTDPLVVSVTVDGGTPVTATAAVPRNDVQSSYPEWGPAHGYAVTLPLGDGDHTLCVTAANAPGTPGSDTQLGCQRVSAQHSPVGALDTVVSRLGKVQVRGWALDPDSATPAKLGLTVDGLQSSAALNRESRQDVAARYPDLGADHGVNAALALPEGHHAVCLTAANVPDTPGSDAKVACQDVTVRHSADGAVDVLRRAPGGVLLTGWAVDPDVDTPLTVDVISDGTRVTSLTTGQSRPGLPPAYSPQGADQGFRALLDLPVGSHRLCPVVRNASGTPGADQALPCSTVLVAHDPEATWDPVVPLVGGALRVSGEALDADVAAPATLGLAVDGVAQPLLGASLPSTTSAARWPGYGSARHFQRDLSLTPGQHQLCLVAKNAAGTPGSDRALGCRTVVAHDALGALESAVVGGHTVVLRGWALDPDTALGTRASVVQDRRTVLTVPATSRQDALATRFPGYGPAHGVSATVMLRPGRHAMCLLAENVPGTPGQAQLVGCRTVTIR